MPLATMSTAQQISVFAPQEDLDFLAYNVDNFPDMLINFFESKKLTVPILGDIDFNKPFADGIRLSADITSSASYKILSADATFDSVKEDYKTPVRMSNSTKEVYHGQRSRKSCVFAIKKPAQIRAGFS